MKTKRFIVAAAALATGSMILSGQGQAAPLCNTLTTIGAWATAGSCLDNTDQDVLFTFRGKTGAIDNATGFTVNELEIGGADLYNVGFDWANGFAGGGSIKYSLSYAVPTSERFIGANFDTIVQGSGANATKQLFTPDGNSPFLTLTSVNGARSPAQGETPFPALAGLIVTDTFDPATGTAMFMHSDNSFGTARIPEPASMALLGLGLAGMGLVRSRRRG